MFLSQGLEAHEKKVLMGYSPSSFGGISACLHLRETATHSPAFS